MIARINLCMAPLESILSLKEGKSVIPIFCEKISSVLKSALLSCDPSQVAPSLKYRVRVDLSCPASRLQHGKRVSQSCVRLV